MIRVIDDTRYMVISTHPLGVIYAEPATSPQEAWHAAVKSSGISRQTWEAKHYRAKRVIISVEVEP